MVRDVGGDAKTKGTAHLFKELPACWGTRTCKQVQCSEDSKVATEGPESRGRSVQLGTGE